MVETELIPPYILITSIYLKNEGIYSHVSLFILPKTTAKHLKNYTHKKVLAHLYLLM